ncbi:MAG: methyltransferase domain-containing protein [Chloroflexota bacterium]
MNGEHHPPICDYEGSDYQAAFWDRGERAYEDRVEAIALKRLLPVEGELLLEIGAGAGRNTPRYRGFRRIVLLDYSVSQLELARSRLGENDRYLYVAGDAYKLPFVDTLFDAVTMIRTLHHLKEAQLALQQTRRVLKAGGIFILEFANKQNLKAILRFLLRRQDWNPFDESPIEFAELNFDFHPKAVRRWLEQSGFAIQRQLTVSHFRMDLLKRYVPLRVLAGLDSLAQWTGNWWQLSPSVFVRAQAVGLSVLPPEGAFFACPQCGGAQFDRQPQALVCKTCHHGWEIRNGIYIFK